MAGRIIDAEIRYDKEGKSRGIGLVKYEYPMEAVQAICILHSYTIIQIYSVSVDRGRGDCIKTIFCIMCGLWQPMFLRSMLRVS